LRVLNDTRIAHISR